LVLQIRSNAAANPFKPGRPWPCYAAVVSVTLMPVVVMAKTI
jgi:hypothetical protein